MEDACYRYTYHVTKKHAEFSFGANHERVKQVRKTGSVTTDTTIYVGALYDEAR